MCSVCWFGFRLLWLGLLREFEHWWLRGGLFVLVIFDLFVALFSYGLCILRLLDCLVLIWLVRYVNSVVVSWSFMFFKFLVVGVVGRMFW